MTSPAMPMTRPSIRVMYFFIGLIVAWADPESTTRADPFRPATRSGYFVCCRITGPGHRQRGRPQVR